MERKKLVKLAKILATILVVLILFVFIVLPKLEDSETIIGKKDEGISTDIPFNASEYDSGKVVQDYSKPTEQERLSAVSEYGVGNTYFDEEGLHIRNMTGVAELDEEILVTDKWPDNELTKAVLKPEMELRKVEVGETYLIISVNNVNKKDMQKYIDDIKDEYKNELEGVHPNSLYRASSDDRNVVDVKFHKGKSQGVIEYKFK